MRLESVHLAVSAAYGRNARVDEAGKAKAGRPAEAGPRTEDLERFTQTLEKFLGNLGVDLAFKVHESGEVQAEVRTADGEKVLRKLPPDELLELAASIRELSGGMVHKKL
jgi:flagellar protein FlaG